MNFQEESFQQIMIYGVPELSRVFYKLHENLRQHLFDPNKNPCIGLHYQDISWKIKTDVSLKLGNQTSIYQRSPPQLPTRKTFFATTRSMLENAIQGKKYFRSLHYTAHTNHHREMFFSLFIVNLVGISNKRQADWFWLNKSSK